MDPEIQPENGMMQPPAGGAAFATEEQKQELLNMIEAIRGKLGEFNATSFAGSNALDKTKRDLLRQVFEKLQLAGIDLNDRESVAAFIEKLRAADPELALMFEESMDALLGEDEPTQGPQDASADMDLGLNQEMNNISPDETLS